MKKHLLLCAIALLILLAVIEAAQAQPVNATTVARGASEKSSSAGSSSQQPSEGGNTTSLTITANSASLRWQGYYGNVTGNVTLGDAQNNVLYNWIDLSPAGEVYAANKSSVNWPKIYCVNFSAPQPDEMFNSSSLNEYIGYASESEKAEGDSVNATFNETFTGSMIVGSRTIVQADNCSMVTLNTGSGYQETQFRELLLTDNETIVFASILENNVDGFKDYPTDFEMIVGVNSTNTRNYFFFVELS